MGDPMYISQGQQNSSIGLNLNDVIEVIGEDLASSHPPNCSSMYPDNMAAGGMGAPSEAEFSTTISTSATTTVDPLAHIKKNAYVRIIEQPQPKALRFRYKCEGRSAGSIPGVRSTAENKTYPAIKVVGYTGPAVVVVSCVTVDPPYRPHPHNLVGKDGCRKGVCTVHITNENMECVFSNLGIQCVKKREAEEALKQREAIRVDPFQTGFSHINQIQSIDLNALRLCFQVFLEGDQKGKFTFPLKAVVSDPIYDKKATSDLLICKLSDCTSTVAGGKEVILLCDKVTKEDIQVRFYEVVNGSIAWEAFGDFQPSDVHKQVAISFKTPRYKVLQIENPVKVYIQLQRPSDKATSDPRPFEYLPLDSGRPYLSFKRLKQSYGGFSRILGLDTSLGLGSSLQDAEKNLPEEELKRKLPVVSSHLSPQRGAPRGTSGGGIVAAASALTPAGQRQPTTSDEVKLKVTAALKKRNPGMQTSTDLNSASPPSKLSPLWSDTSCYSDTEMLEDMFSEGSVNDILSGVGGGVYQDLDSSCMSLTNNNASLNAAINNTLNLLSSPGQLDTLLLSADDIGEPSPPMQQLVAQPSPSSTNTHPNPDALYGDASYASCYSNLQFVMNRAKSAGIEPSGTGGSDSLIRGAMFPSVPAKVTVTAPPRQDDAEDAGIYEVPSSRPIHATKEALLHNRGFSVQQQSHVITEIDLEPDDDLLPKTVLDLFV